MTIAPQVIGGSENFRWARAADPGFVSHLVSCINSYISLSISLARESMAWQVFRKIRNPDARATLAITALGQKGLLFTDSYYIARELWGTNYERYS